VVLDAGLSRTSLDWSLVQPEIGKTTQVCAYDRAGMGWSDPAPQDKPRTPGQIATELHTLLANAGIAGPYVLVGHSLAGKNVRMFALQHPDEVAGMVLVDARGEYVDEHSTPADEQAFRDGMANQGNIYRLARTLGLARLLGAGQEGSPAMTDRTRMEMVLFTTGQQGIDTTMAEGLQRAADDAQLHSSSLGDKPLIVLASGLNMKQLPNWPESQRLMSKLSTNGRLAVIEGSGHSIHVEQPAVVIDAVQQVLAQVRGH
jgi:pimeloyl-ACP methyl ester carboxylesterase